MTARSAALEVVRRLREAGFEAYWVGGCVRDLLLGRSPADYDVATSAPPSAVRQLYPDAIPVGVQFGVVRVRVGEHEIEVAQFRTEGPYLDGRHPSEVRPATAEEDARRRDFTINGLFYDPLTGTVFDWVGGLPDLRARLIRTIGDPEARFREDRLRMLRAVRLSCELDFRIEQKTQQAIRSLAGEIRSISPERIRDELCRLLTGPRRGRGLLLLDELGLLPHILPEVAAMKGVPQPPEHHPEGDVFTHTMLVLDALRDPSPSLAFAALLHDVGKPLVRREDGPPYFPGHDRVGATIAAEVLRRLRCSSEEVERVATMVRDHMRVGELPRMREAKRLAFFARPDFDELLELYRADCLASGGDLSTYEWIRAARSQLRPEQVQPPRLVTGHDLIAMGLRPGPVFRELLEAVRDAQLEGRVQTREQALELLRDLVRKLPTQEESTARSNTKGQTVQTRGSSG